MAACHIPDCMGNYDFEKIVFFAKKRYIEGCNTTELMEAAKTEREKEEIALVSLLHVKNDQIQDLQLTCIHTDTCKVIDCRERLINMLEKEIGTIPE